MLKKKVKDKINKFNLKGIKNLKIMERGNPSHSKVTLVRIISMESINNVNFQLRNDNTPHPNFVFTNFNIFLAKNVVRGNVVTKELKLH